MVLVTTGEPAGIGPDIALSLRNDSRSHEYVLVGDLDMLRARARMLASPVKLCEYERESHEPAHDHEPTVLSVLHIPLCHRPVRLGFSDPRNAPYVIRQLATASDRCFDENSVAMVTCPVQKSVINDSGFAFSGHTEYLARRFGCNATMMLALEHGLKVALATTHLPLREVPEKVSNECVFRTVSATSSGLRSYFNVDSPRILVCGLNPHAGEGGYLGDEEQNVIQPAVARARECGIAVTGPVAADTAFTEQSLANTDAVVAMYHDQALPVIKSIGFKRVINLTLGLPILRVSVDHGVALDLAGSGRADPSSLMHAAEFASRASLSGSSSGSAGQ